MPRRPCELQDKEAGLPDVEDVEAILPSNHPGEKLATVVPDAEDLAVDHHTGAALIELPRLMMEFPSAGM